MDNILTIYSIVLSITVVICMARAIKGPLPADRLIAVNVICTKVVVLIAFVSFILHETYCIDVILVYAMISFMASLGLSDIIREWRGGRVWK